MYFFSNCRRKSIAATLTQRLHSRDSHIYKISHAFNDLLVAASMRYYDIRTWNAAARQPVAAAASRANGRHASMHFAHAPCTALKCRPNNLIATNDSWYVLWRITTIIRHEAPIIRWVFWRQVLNDYYLIIFMTFLFIQYSYSCKFAK